MHRSVRTRPSPCCCVWSASGIGACSWSVGAAVLLPSRRGVERAAPCSDAKAVHRGHPGRRADRCRCRVESATDRSASTHPTSLLVINIASVGALHVSPELSSGHSRRVLVPIVVGSAVRWQGQGHRRAPGERGPVAGASNGSTVGPGDPLDLDEPDSTDRATSAARWRRSTWRPVASGPVAGRWQTTCSLLSDAVRLGVYDRRAPFSVRRAPTLGDFIVNLDGTTVQTAARP